jgi:hypothetical protein
MLQESFLNHWLEMAVKILRKTHEESARPDLCASHARIASSHQELAIPVEAHLAMEQASIHGSFPNDDFELRR